MNKYKHLKSVGHNWADSFLSIENFDKNHNYFIGLLTDAALENGTSKIVINLLNGDISPSKIKNNGIEYFTKKIPWDFSRLLVSQSCQPRMVRNARLEIVYDFEPVEQLVPDIDRYFSFAYPENAPKQAIYKASVFIMDDRAKLHTASVKEWWRF